MLIQVASVLGAILVLGAFAAHQAKRLQSETYAYQLMNLFGGFLLCVAAISTRQAGLILMEGAWTAIAAWGLVRVMRKA